MRQQAPIDRLMELLKEHGFTMGRDFFSYALAKGIVTPEWLFAQTGCDEVLELATEIKPEVAKYLEAGKQRAGVRR